MEGHRHSAAQITKDIFYAPLFYSNDYGFCKYKIYWIDIITIY